MYDMFNLYDEFHKISEFKKSNFLFDTFNSINYSNFWDEVNKVSSQIKSFSPAHHSPIAVYTGCGLNYWINLFAVWASNCYTVSINHSLQPNKIASIIEQVNPCLVVKGKEIKPTSIKSISKSEKNIPDNTALINFSSGTTGKPKGIILTHQSIYENVVATSRALSLFQSKDRLMINLGFQFISALSHFLVTFHKGASLFCIERTCLGSDITEIINEHQISCFGGSPNQLRWIVEHSQQLKKNLNWIMSSGDFLSPTVIAEAQKKIPSTKIYTVYGMTELSGRFCILQPENTQHAPGSVGKPINCLTIKICNSNNKILPPNEIGDIYAKGSSLFYGYLNQNSQKTEKWFKTGDIGYINTNGNLYLKGRNDNVIKISGHKVCTFEIDDCLNELESLADVFTIVLPFNTEQKQLITFYSLKLGKKLDSFEAIRLIRTRLSSLHIPSKFIQLKQIPRTKSGKPQRNKLRKIATEQMVNVHSPHLTN